MFSLAASILVARTKQVAFIRRIVAEKYEGEDGEVEEEEEEDSPLVSIRVTNFSLASFYNFLASNLFFARSQLSGAIQWRSSKIRVFVSILLLLFV